MIALGFAITLTGLFGFGAVNKGLAREGIEPNAVAPIDTRLRRLSYDLTGLPPSPALPCSVLGVIVATTFLMLGMKMLSERDKAKLTTDAW